MTHPVARRIAKQLREGATVVMPNSIVDDVKAVFPRNRVAACMILGDSYVQEELINTVDSIKEVGIDKLFLAYNGKSRRTLQWLFDHLQKIDLPFLVQKFAWEDDFSKARQQSFDMVPKDEFGWIMWVDADDIIIAEKSLEELFESLDPYTQGIYLRYDYAVEPDSGKVSVQQWRERILSTKVNWVWKYPIHEVATCPIGTQFAKRDHIYIRHQRDADSARGARERNRRIVSKSLKENPKDPRMQFYFATELMAEADGLQGAEKSRVADAAILAYKRFMSNEDASADDLYIAATRIGDLFLMKGDYNASIDAYLQSLKVHPEWPDAYIGIARAAMESEDWGKCKSFATIALQRNPPLTSSIVTPLTYIYTPYLIRGIANEKMGLYKEAKDDFLEAKAVWNPPNGMLEEHLKEIEEKLSGKTEDKEERKKRRGSRPEKSIAFVTAPLPESWHPETEKVSGAGGAETCIMRLAPRFAADGWRVAVFGTPGVDHRGVDESGVEWWNSEEFIPNERFKVVVASRIPELFAADVNADHKILWMHDVNVGPRMHAFEGFPDTIVGLTNWHVQHMGRLYGIPKQRFNVIPNGVELHLYDIDKRKDDSDELRMIWSSSPDRGLGTVISLWPTIRSWYPNARLDVFYGWNIIDKIITKGDKRSGYLHKMKSELLGNIARIGGEEAGIYQYGRVPQHDLSEWQLSAHIWPYPTDFMETFCITAIEMQAAGVIPITSNLAALKETVACAQLRVDGWPLNRDYQNQWLKVLERVVEAEPEHQSELQQEGRRHAEKFSWDNSYAKWNEMFRRLDG